MPKAEDVLSCNLSHTIDPVVAAGADDAMSDVSVAFTSGEPNTNGGRNALRVLSMNSASPCRETMPHNL